ncbi:MAG: hypothetical protein AAGA06_04190 [Pseudomonadota bacterium]
MTETTAYTEFPKRQINWIAFVGALIFAPVFIQLIGLALTVVAAPVDASAGASALVLVLAPFFGLKTYLLFGAPLFALYLKFCGSNPWGLAAVGFVANLISIPLVYFDAELAGNDGVHFVRNVVGLGCFVAPIWAFTFGCFYRGFTHD